VVTLTWDCALTAKARPNTRITYHHPSPTLASDAAKNSCALKLFGNVSRLSLREPSTVAARDADEKITTLHPRRASFCKEAFRLQGCKEKRGQQMRSILPRQIAKAEGLAI